MIIHYSYIGRNPLTLVIMNRINYSYFLLTLIADKNKLTHLVHFSMKYYFIIYVLHNKHLFHIKKYYRQIILNM